MILNVGDIVCWYKSHDTSNYEVIGVCGDNRYDFKNHKTGCIYYRHNMADSFRKDLVQITKVVKDTRLARKLYPKAEKLDNGMLRIRS